MENRSRRGDVELKIWVVSDLHSDMKMNENPWSNRQECDLLLLAGDIGRDRQAIFSASKMFRSAGNPGMAIVQIAGNHEYYNTGRGVDITLDAMRQAAASERENGRNHWFLENETVDLQIKNETVRIIGATLWTDFRLHDDQEFSCAQAGIGMNDYFNIMKDKTALTPETTIEWHERSRRFIEDELSRPFEGRRIVMTHHLPSGRSIAEKHMNSPLNPAFASDCDDLLAMGADLWIHGHTHSSMDYHAGKTRVICNPRGYRTLRGYENSDFDPQLAVDLETYRTTDILPPCT